MQLNIRNKEAGFTLIEIMVVIAIIGILATLIVPRIMGRPDEARATAAKHDIDAIHDYLIHREKPVEGVDTAMQFPHVNVDNAGFNV